jgi:Rod binding domain-containing protein
MELSIPTSLGQSYPNHLPQNDSPQKNPKTIEIREAARELETVFIAEMLKSSGFGKARDSFGGGAGEDQFSSLLVRAQAEQITRAGGIGLAESLFNALMGIENVTSNHAESS